MHPCYKREAYHACYSPEAINLNCSHPYIKHHLAGPKNLEEGKQMKM